MALGVLLNQIRIGGVTPFTQAPFLFIVDTASLLNVMLGVELTTMESVIIGVSFWDDAGLIGCGSCGVGHVIVVCCRSVCTMVKMRVVVFVRNVEGRVVVADNAGHWGAVMPVSQDIRRRVSIGHDLLLTRNVGHVE